MPPFNEIIPYTVDSWNELDPKSVRQSMAISAYYEFIRDTYPVVERFEFNNIPEHSEKFAVILEPRREPLLEYVLKNVMHFLGEGWGLQIFAGNKNEDYVREITRNWKTVHIENIGVDNLRREEFRALRKDPEFWKKMRGETLLCFETDTLLCRRGVDEFLGYDFIGAPWTEKMAISPTVRIGNGGLSVRRRDAMIDICESCNSKVIPSEDSFFSYHLHLRKEEFNLPTVDTANRFSVESMFYPEPIGFHKPWLYITEDRLRVILKSVDYDSQKK
jgi:hypothetical protein